jgi:hypothetical protein
VMTPPSSSSGVRGPLTHEATRFSGGRTWSASPVADHDRYGVARHEAAVHTPAGDAVGPQIELAAGEADVADHAHQPASGHKRTEALAPDLLERPEELLVVRDVAELAAEMCGPLFAKTTAAQVPVDGGNERVI